MANLDKSPTVAVAATATWLFIIATLLLSHQQHLTEAQTGVCYGMNGDNLPSPQDVVNLYKSNGIKSMRLYSSDRGTLQALQDTLQALQGTDIKVTLGVANEKIQSLASCLCAAKRWVRLNVVPFWSFINYIVVGNEIEPSDKEASLVVSAMQNILRALNESRTLNNFNDEIKVSTAINQNLITNSYPPSNGQFQNLSYMKPIIDLLTSHDSPLLVNIYPYFAYVNDTQHISLDYALFNAPKIVFTDPSNGLGYKNLFDAMLDSVYAALRRAGAHHTRVVVSESGWPSDGGSAATIDNAKTYYTNLVNHVEQGTPLMAGQPIETYLFSMFDENKKQGADTERHFGIFYPNQQPKYGQLILSKRNEVWSA